MARTGRPKQPFSVTAAERAELERGARAATFAYLTTQLTQRGVHKSVQAPEADVRAWVQQWNTNPKPFVWTKTAEKILDSLARYLQRISGAEH